MSLQKFFLKNCPTSLRGKIIRNKISIDYETSEDFVIKVAETTEELRGAFQVLHDSYVEKDYMLPQASGIRLTPYHILPTTTTFVVKVGESVIGTMSVIKDGALGLPSDTLFDLSFLRDKNLQIAEISSLAIHPEYRMKGGRVLFSLMKFMWHYVTEYMPLDAMVVSVNPAQMPLYDDILFFTEMKLQVKAYSFVKGAEAIGRYALIKDLKGLFNKHYADKPLAKNLFHFFFEYTDSHLIFPKRPFFKVTDPVLSSEQTRSLFLSEKQIFQGLTIEKKIRCLMSFKGTESENVVREVLEINGDVLFFKLRKDLRFESHLNAETPESEKFTITSVSRGGVAIDFTSEQAKQLCERKLVTIKVLVGKNLWANLVIEPVARSFRNESRTGARIIAADDIWKSYIHFLESDLNRNTTEKFSKAA